MRRSLKPAAALSLVLGSTVSAQSLTTNFAATTTFSGANTGNFFDVRALHASGVTLDSFDVNVNSAAGTALDVEVWVKQGSFVGFEQNPGAWVRLGIASATSAGQGQPTPVAVGGLFLPFDEVWAIRTNHVTGGVRYNNAATTIDVYSNGDLELTNGAAQSGLFTGTPNIPRGWNGTVYYTVGNTAVTGACCEPDGTCFVDIAAFCAAVGGVYQGNGTGCTASCPQPGACCFENGVCSFIIQAACVADGGAFAGAGVACVAANCPQPGFCCLPDGTCVLIASARCLAGAGVYGGNGSSCGSAACAQPLYLNGSTRTGIGNGFDGHDTSRADTNVTSAGTDCTPEGAGPARRLADDVIFTGDVTVNGVVVYGYITGVSPNGYSYPPVSPFTGGDVKIWDGNPSLGTSNVVASSSTFHSTGWTGIYRLFNTTPAANTDRPVMYVRFSFPGVSLPAGTYWVDYQLTGNHGGSTVGFSSYVMEIPAGTTFVGNAWALDPDPTGWFQAAPAPIGQPVDFPFAILGSAGGGCYANCDQSTTAPVLNVADFTCFLQRFAAGEAYANCDESTTAPVLNVADFTCFLQRFAAGCN